MRIDETIKNILINGIATNKSGGEVVLSIGESLLLALDACKQANIDKITVDKLNKLYLEGVKTDEDKEFIKSLEEILVEKNYVVSSDPKVINDDPTRRYFETNLAYHILQNNAESLDHKELSKFTQNLKHRLFSLPNSNPKDRIKIEKILKGEIDEKLLNKYELEYAELISKLLRHDYHGLSEKACKNLYQVASSTILATLNTQADKSMPINIYNDSIFTMGPDGRGRVVKTSNDEVKTTVKGLMKSISPVPRYDDLVNPVEGNYSKEAFSLIQRSADQANFSLESQWSQLLFSRQTQLYSNGISSTTLAQIRNVILQKRLGNPHQENDFQDYMTLFAALMLYNSGGHSFFEIFEVFKLPMCRELMESSHSWEGNQVKDDLMYKLLYEDQKDAYEKALESTQIYMRSLLHKKMLNAEIKLKAKLKNEVESEAEIISSTNQMQAPTIHQAVIKSDITAFESLLEDKSNINQKSHVGWTALMIASQLGKVEYVQKLLDAGADVGIQANDLSALELAVKHQQFETVKLLLASDHILVKRSNRGNLKEKAPALYLACRQNNMGVLEAMLNHLSNLTIKDKEAALLTALEIENFPALKMILTYLDDEKKPGFFAKKYKFQLLQEAAKLGTDKLISQIINLDSTHTTTEIEYKKLLNIATKNGFIQVAEKLLESFYVAHDRQEFQKNEFLLDLNNLLKIALQHNRFDMALFFIIHGADPNSIPTVNNSVREFYEYLQNIEYDKLLFLQENQELASARAQSISNAIAKGEENTFLKYIVEFINNVLPERWKLSYNNKTAIMANMAQLFNGDKENIQQQNEIPIEKNFSASETDSQLHAARKQSFGRIFSDTKEILRNDSDLEATEDRKSSSAIRKTDPY